MLTFQSVLSLKEPYPFDNFIALALAESREVVDRKGFVLALASRRLVVLDQGAILAGDDG